MSQPKRRRTCITTAQKHEICKYKTDNMKKTYEELSAHFSLKWEITLGKSTIGDIWAKKDEWLTKSVHDKTIRSSTPKFQELEDALFLWFGQARSAGLTVSDLILRTKAQSLGERLGVTDFQYSNGWLQRFKSRRNISCHKYEGEADSANRDVVGQGRADVNELLKDYQLVDIYNMDETGLFYALTPNATLATGPTKGKKKSKDRITVALCSNADGSHKLKPLVIAKAKKPRCFGRDYDPNIYVTYRWNKKAWMTGLLFIEWLTEFNSQMRLQGRHIVLLLDNAGSHTVPPPLSNIKVHFLPPNTTAHLQPMDGGIIQNFKVNYRRHQGLHFLRCMETDLPLTVSIRHAIGFLHDAWQDVTATTISNCWRHVGIIAGKKAILYFYN